MRCTATHRLNVTALISLCLASTGAVGGWPNAAWPQGGWRRDVHVDRLGIARDNRRELPTLPRWIANKVAAEAQKQGLDPRLALALVAQESAGNPFARSAAGAIGLTQLMPTTAHALRLTDPYDLDQNLTGGLRYLKAQIERFGSLRLALAAYNSGPGLVAKRWRVPNITETQDYVQRICGSGLC
jgi:soluble lytic murein transglycosylase-like protein